MSTVRVEPLPPALVTIIATGVGITLSLDDAERVARELLEAVQLLRYHQTRARRRARKEKS